MKRWTITVACCLLPAALFAAEPEDKDLTIMRLKKANLEMALEIMRYRFADTKAELDKIAAEIDAKEKAAAKEKETK